MTHATMVITMQVAAGHNGLRPVRVSMPLIQCLIDVLPTKYALPEALPPPRDAELRPPRLGQPRAVNHAAERLIRTRT